MMKHLVFHTHATKKNDATLTVGIVYLHIFIFCETACTLSSKMQVMMFNFSRRVSQCSSSHLLESIFYPLLISLLSVPRSTYCNLYDISERKRTIEKDFSSSLR